MDITLIVPAHNEEDWIGPCLDSVAKNVPGKFREVIVVDNASTDKTPEVALARGARVVSEPHKGLTRARQKGLDAATTEYVAYVDADCRLTPHWFAALEKHRARHPEFVSLTGPVTYYDGPRTLGWFIYVLEWLTLPLGCWIAGYHILGGNFVARRDALLAVGGFDPNIAFYGEDFDIARRLSAHGYVLLRMDFSIQTSMRRFLEDGFFGTCTRYTINFFWNVLFHRPLTQTYTDVRS